MKTPMPPPVLTVWLVAAVALAAADDAVRFGETTVAPNVVVQGAQTVVTIPFQTEPEWRYLAYSLGAYRPYVPTACLTAALWPLSESPHGREWDSFQIRPWTWHDRKTPPPAALVITLETVGWPPGDYRLYASLLFRHDALPEAQRDRYIHRTILLSVLPAAPGKR